MSHRLPKTKNPNIIRRGGELVSDKYQLERQALIVLKCTEVVLNLSLMACNSPIDR